MSKKDKKDEDLQGDFSTNEFDEIYGDDEPALTEIDSIDVSDVEEVTDSDLDFIEEDIEEVFSEEDDAAVADSVGEDLTSDDLDTAAAPKKKKSSFGLALVSLLVLGGAGAGAYFSGMIPGLTPPSSLSYQPTQAQQQPEANTSGSINDDIFADQQVVTEQPEENQQDMEALYADSFPDEEQAAAEDNQGFLDTEEVQTTEEDSGVDMFAAPEPEGNVVADPFGEEDIAVVEEPVVEEAPIIEMAAPVTPMAAPTVNTEELSNLTNQMNELQGNMNSRLADLENAIKNLPTTGGSDGAAQVDLSGIESSIAKLNSRLDKMEDEIASVKKTANEASAKATEAKAAPSKPAPVKAAPKKAAAPAKASAPSWEIRAIQVGKAVIAEKGKSGTRSISVGDSIPGLGTIKDINYKNGGWVIKGSGGSIKQ